MRVWLLNRVFEQFLLLPQWFQKLSAAIASEVSVWGKGLTYPLLTSRQLDSSVSHDFWKHCGKRRNMFLCKVTFLHIQCVTVECERCISFMLINLFPYKEAFWHICSRQLLKTYLQMEKLLNMLKQFLISSLHFQFCSVIILFLAHLSTKC